MIDDFGRQRVGAARPAEPLDRAAREPRRLPHAADRAEVRAAVRHAGRLRHQHPAARPGRRGVPAPHPLQGVRREPVGRRLRADLGRRLRRARHRLRPRAGRARPRPSATGRGGSRCAAAIPATSSTRRCRSPNIAARPRASPSPFSPRRATATSSMTRRTERSTAPRRAILATVLSLVAAVGVRLRADDAAARGADHLAARPHRHARRGPHRRARRARPATPPIQGVKFFVNGDLGRPGHRRPGLRRRLGRRQPVRADRDLGRGHRRQGPHRDQQGRPGRVRLRRAGRGDQRAGRGDRARQDRPADRAASARPASSSTRTGRGRSSRWCGRRSCRRPT